MGRGLRTKEAPQHAGFLFVLTFVRALCYNESISGRGEEMFKEDAKCPECDRIFDLSDEAEADEWYSGHDCEAK